MLMEAQSGDWDEVDDIIRLFQGDMMKLKGLEAGCGAPHRMTLGGGVEACLPADRIIFSAETYFGLVETGSASFRQAAELALMTSNRHPDKESDLQPEINKIFEMVAMAKASTSGHEAIRMGYGRSGDTVVMNQDYRIMKQSRRYLRWTGQAMFRRAGQSPRCRPRRPGRAPDGRHRHEAKRLYQRSRSVDREEAGAHPDGRRCSRGNGG